MHIHRRIIITIVVLGLATLTIGGAVGVPSVLRIQSLRASIIQKRKLIDRRYALRNYVRNSLTEIQKTRTELDTVRSMAVQEGKEIDFVRALEKAASKSGVQMTIDLQTVNEKSISSWERTIPITVKATGKFPQTTSFLNEIEHLPYYVIFNTLTLTVPQNAGAIHDGTVQAVYSGNVYWQSANVPDFLKVDTISAEAQKN